LAVMDVAGACGFARAASQALVDVFAGRFPGDGAGFGATDEVDAASGGFGFFAGFDEGGAAFQAKPTPDAGGGEIAELGHGFRIADWGWGIGL